MSGLKRRLLYSRASRWIASGTAALGVLLVLSFLVVQGSAAHPAQPTKAVTLSFTVTITAGTAPDDAVFWVCPDAQADGTGCDQMNGQGNGPYTFQLMTTSGTTYHHIVLEWTHGRQPSSTGPLPQSPILRLCTYPNVTVGAEPGSFTCMADFTAITATPSPPASTRSPAASPTSDPVALPGADTGATLVTGLQIVIGVGLALFVLLVIILIFQRLGARRR